MRKKTLSLLLLSLLLPVSLSAQTFRPRIMSGLRLTMLPSQSQDPMQLINSSGTILALLNNAGRFEVAVLTNAGACTDAVFTFTPVDGSLCVDTTADELYFRTSGAWFSIDPAGGGGITTLNGLSVASQSFTIGTAGTDFAVSSAGSVHTFDLPDASATARGLVTTAAQTFAGTKTTPIWNASTGFQIAGAAASGNVPRGNGTNFVSAILNFSDLAGSATDAQIPNTITLNNLTQITTRNHSSLQGIVATDHHAQRVQIWRGGFYEASPSTGLTTIPLPVADQCAAGISVQRVTVAAITKGSGTMTFQVTRYNNAGVSQGNIFSGNQTYSNVGNNRQDFTATTTTATANDYFRFNIVTVNAQADVSFIVEGRCNVL